MMFARPATRLMLVLACLLAASSPGVAWRHVGLDGVASLRAAENQQLAGMEILRRLAKEKAEVAVVMTRDRRRSDLQLLEAVLDDRGALRALRVRPLSGGEASSIAASQLKKVVAEDVTLLFRYNFGRRTASVAKVERRGSAKKRPAKRSDKRPGKRKGDLDQAAANEPPRGNGARGRNDPDEGAKGAGKKKTARRKSPRKKKGSGSPEERVPSNWPRLRRPLAGALPVRIRNPNAMSVRVGLRVGEAGRDFIVGPNGIFTVGVPSGRYEIYFQYSTDPKSLYKGDNFTLAGNGVEIQLVRVVNGNYGVRKVK